jgi:hypothetical protein
MDYGNKRRDAFSLWVTQHKRRKQIKSGAHPTTKKKMFTSPKTLGGVPFCILTREKY